MLVLKSYKNVNGIALVAAVVVTLIVSLVAVAIASTAPVMLMLRLDLI